MGNYCCQEEKQDLNRSSARRKKAILNDENDRRQYQNDLSTILNNALVKYSEGKSILSLCIVGEVGKGGQASVFLVELQQTDSDGQIVKKFFAMKRVSKRKLDIHRTKQALLLEKQILASHKSDFLTEISYALQDKSYLYYLMDLAQGGDLFSFIKASDEENAEKVQSFQEKGEKAVVFVLAGVVLGLEYLHYKNIIYRDLKPENILIYSDGYPRLADFGIAKKNKNNQLCYDIKGTLIYFAPEMVAKKGYDKSIDFWALGILTYELLFKEPLFTSAQINSSKFQLKCLKWEQNPYFRRQATENAIDFMRKLLRVKPEERLGFSGFESIKEHAFFEQIDWNEYENKKVQSPLTQIIENFPLRLQKNRQIDRTIDIDIERIDDRQYIPFTFVKNTAVSNSSQISEYQIHSEYQDF